MAATHISFRKRQIGGSLGCCHALRYIVFKRGMASSRQSCCRWQQRLRGQTMLNVFIENNCEKIPESGCWIWMKSCTKQGYGDFRLNKKHYTTHVASYEAFKGSRNGLHVLHTCDVRCCCNPNHLFLGTNADNIADSIAKGRRKGITRKRPLGLIYNRTKPSGPKRFLSATQENLVLAMTEKGHSQRSLAKYFGVSDTTIHNTLKRLSKC